MAQKETVNSTAKVNEPHHKKTGLKVLLPGKTSLPAQLHRLVRILKLGIYQHYSYFYKLLSTVALMSLRICRDWCTSILFEYTIFSYDQAQIYIYDYTNSKDPDKSWTSMCATSFAHIK